MAQITLPSTSGTLQQTLLKLDSADEPFSVHLAEACKIIGLDVEGLRESVQERENSWSSFTPREDWVLKWLVKKLQSSIGALESACLERRAWLLLQVLLRRVPPAGAARLLGTHGFTAILGETLEWLVAAGQTGLLGSRKSSNTLAGGPLDESDVDRSSSTMLESPSIHAVKMSRKRKREDSVVDQPAMTELYERSYVDGSLLYEAVCGALGQIIHLTEQYPGEMGGFASEHMKAMLRLSPDEAAKVLGSSIYMVTRKIEQPGILQENRNSQPLEHLSTFLSPMVALWDLRSGAADDLAGQASNHAFSVHCLMPALHLLSRCEAETYRPLVSTITYVLEQLIIKYVIMPTRVTLLETIRPGKPQNDGVSAPLMHDLFQPLQLECSRELKENALRTTADSSTRTLSTIPLLFNLVIRCTPLANTKHRTAEMPWLQSLFICLAQCASAPVSASSMSPPARLSLQVLERMLGIAVASNIQLGTSLLENVMSQFSGIASSELSDVNWELVGLCLKLDPNVFLMPSSTRDSGKTRPPQLGSDFLAPLLAKITAIGLKKPQGAPALYGLVLSDIVLPLVAAFAHARGLDRFVGCWQEQLRLCENSQCTSATDITIWEDEALLHLVARLLEPSLITAQIEKIFYAAYVDLDKGSAIGPNSTGAMASVSSVIIECIVDGCTRETVTAKLTNTAQLVYHLSLLILKEAPYRTTKLRWRLWRIAASLRSHWPGASSPPNVSDAASAAENRALAKASETFLRSTDSGWLPQDRMEALQAFKFVLSFAPVEQRTDLEKGLPQYQIKSAIRWVTKCLKNELEKTDPNRSPRWDGKAATAISQEALLIGCVTQLLISSTALNCCGPKLQRKFFSTLSMCAWQQGRHHPDHVPTAIRYPWLWQKLLHSDLLKEEASLASCLRKVQVTEYQDLTESSSAVTGESRQWFVAKGLLSTSMDTLERRQRALISNCTLRKLLQHHRTMVTQELSDYVNLLGRTVEKPSKSLELFTEPSALWNLAKVFDETRTIVNISALTSLRRVMHATLSYLIYTVSEARSAGYLRTFYDLLRGELLRTKSLTKAYGSSTLIGQSMALFQRHWNSISQALEQERSTFTDLCQEHFDILLTRLHMYEKEWMGVPSQPSCAEAWSFNLGNVLDSLAEYADLLSARPDVTTFTTMWPDILRELVGRSFPKKIESSELLVPQDAIILSMELMLVKMDRLAGLVEKWGIGSAERLQQVVNLLRSLCITHSKQIVLNNFKTSAEALGPDGKADLLATLVGGDESNTVNDGCLLLFQGVVASMEDSSQQLPTVEHAISHCMAVLCDQLARSEEYCNYILTWQCLDLVLQKRPWAVSQWHIDTLLGALTVLMSPSAPHFGNDHAGSVYTSLCRLCGTIFATYRTKVGGRYHLVLPALQGLLRCLFIPHVRNGGTAAALTLPPWLNGRDSMLSKTHAAGFARLLMTICDPTVSSVARSRNRSRQELNDATKKARSIAGQYLPYMITVYCQCQLKGRLLPQAKAALTPGLYAVFDVMSQDTMRTINAAMDSSSRAIFKALYDDYRRFGRWEGA